MARESNDYTGDPFFVTSRDTGNIQTQVVRGAPIKIHRAASQSMGKDVSVEYVDPSAVDDWVPSDGELQGTENSGPSGFAKYEQLYGDLHQDQGRFAVENFLGPPSEMEQQHILEAAEGNQSLMGRRIERDPVTRIPENVAEVDRLSESDKFYGKDKTEAETSAVLERMKHVDRTQERVDYKSSKAVPIKVIRSN